MIIRKAYSPAFGCAHMGARKEPESICAPQLTDFLILWCAASLKFCTPHGNIFCMSVVHKENDLVLQGMLQDELDRCEEMIASLRKAVEEFPRGSLHQRQRNYKGKVSVYHYRKFRDQGKSVYQHVPAQQVAILEQKIEERRKKEAALKKFSARAKYLRKLLKV